MIAIVGIGTGVGKTVVSAIFSEALQADYWKPVQCGHLDHPDKISVQQLISNKKTQILPEAYQLQAPLSPHHASRLENISLNLDKLILPPSPHGLIIEGVGGIMVPINQENLMIDVIASWKVPCVLISRHYLGSINHTLLSLEALKYRKIEVLGIIFNGSSQPDTEQIIAKVSQRPILGRLNQEPNISKRTVLKYAKRWKNSIKKLLGGKRP